MVMNLITSRPAACALLLCAAVGAWADNGTVYRCPGPPVLYTDQITAAQAKERGCRTIEGAPITIVSPPRQRLVSGGGAAPARPSEGKVDPGEQRARDSDARKILDNELRREEGKLAELQRELGSGEPERRGDERNYQKYLDRVEELKAAIDRKQSDIAALRRELSKLPASKE
jgi:hypothetical protein